MADIPLVRFDEEDQRNKIFAELTTSLSTLNNYLLQSNELMEEEETVRKEGKKEKKEQNKLFQKTTDTFKMVGTKISSSLDNFKNNLIENFIGPLKLITNPLKEFTGIDLVGKFQELTLPKKKKKKEELEKKEISKPRVKPKALPTKADLSKTESGQAILYDINQREKEGKKEKKGLFKSDMFKNIGAFLKTALPVAGLIGGIAWAVFDGIKAVISDTFEASKVATFIGGFLGGMGSGFKNAFKSGGKFALIGAGTGFLVGGPIGALIGGLLGAAIGGLLGYIGGKKIAQSLDKVAEFVGQKFITPLMNAMKGLGSFLFGGLLNLIEGFKSRFDFLKEEDMTLGQKIKGIGKETLHLLTGGLFREGGLINSLFDKLTQSVKELELGNMIQNKLKVLTDSVLGFFTSIGDFFSFIITGFKDKPLEFIKTIATGRFGEEFAGFRQQREIERQVLQDNSINLLNDEMKRANEQKAMKDQEIINELKKLNEKDQRTENIIQNNVSTGMFDSESIRRGLSYQQ